MTAEPPSLLSPPPTVVRRVRARVLCLGRQVTLGTPLRRMQQYGYWSHSPGTLVAPEEGRLEVEFMRERESP